MAEGERDVIVISDESEEESDKHNVGKTPDKALFDEYVVCCHELMSRIRDEQKVHKIEKHLLKVYKAAQPDYTSSEEFLNTLKQQLEELRKPDAKDTSVFACIRAVLIHLKGAAASTSRGSSNGKAEVDTSEREKTRESSDNGGINSGGNAVDGSGHENNVKATSYPNEQDIRAGRGGEGTSSEIEKSHKIRRLEKLMGRLHKEIRRYSEKELTLDDMLQKQSPHITEHKLRKRFVEAWQKWCKVKGYKARTGRPMERKLKFEGTRYPEINSQVQRLIRRNEFPDFHDVYRLVKRVNSKKGLGVRDVHRLSQEVFKDIGQLFSKRRLDELMSNPGYGPLIDIPEDPADTSPDLKRQLEANALVGKHRMDAVLEKYTNVQNSQMAMGVDMEVKSEGASDEDLDADEDKESGPDDDDYDEDESEKETDEHRKEMLTEGDKNIEDATVSETGDHKEAPDVTSQVETSSQVDSAKKKRKHVHSPAASSRAKEVKLEGEELANHEHASRGAETDLVNGKLHSACRREAGMCEPQDVSSRTKDPLDEGASVSYGSSLHSDSKLSSTCGNDNQKLAALLPSSWLDERESVAKTQSTNTCAQDNTTAHAPYMNGLLSGTKVVRVSGPPPKLDDKELASASGKTCSSTSKPKEDGSGQAHARHLAPQKNAHHPGVRPARRINTVCLETSTPSHGSRMSHPAQSVRRQSNGLTTIPTSGDGDDEVIILD